MWSAEWPVLHLRKASSPPPLVTKLEDPATASAWYTSSPTWFGLGGLTADRNHTEILATYDDTALYVAILDIDRATVLCSTGGTPDLTTVDSDAIWIQTPIGRRYCFTAAMDSGYPPSPRQASGEFPSFDPRVDKLQGWSHSGWYGGNQTIQQTIRIPWSAMGVSAPLSGERWRVNFVNYNQTSLSGGVASVKKQSWSRGTEDEADYWGVLAFDEAVFTPPAGISPEAILTLRPGTGSGGEVTLQAGNGAARTNQQWDEALTQSNWNDCDPVDYALKEYMQFDLSMIPKGRKIVSATLKNYFRGHFESDPSDLYLHVVRLAGGYDPNSVTMLTSPLPVENGCRTLVRASAVDSWVNFDVTDAVTKSYESGAGKVSLALAGSSGDIHNGKIWDVSFGRADWYDAGRPRLVITFGTPNVTYASPVKIGSTNYTSVASTSSKNKLTNGTFSSGALEGIANTTYWSSEPAFVYVNDQNVRLMRKDGDVNPNTGHTALKFMAIADWQGTKQIATGITGGRSYTFSGWFKGSASGVDSGISLNFLDASGNDLGGNGYTTYGGSGGWRKVTMTCTAPQGTVKAQIQVFNTTTVSNAYLLYSDFQLEEGTSATSYSETAGWYYPDAPRNDGQASSGVNWVGLARKMPVGTQVQLTDRVVTASFPDCFYIECPEAGHWVCGVKVASNAAPTVGSKVTITGTMSRDANDETQVSATSVTTAPGGAIRPPMGCANGAVGGGTDYANVGPDGGFGLNTVGVLQTTWGRVLSVVPNVSMIVDDGSDSPVKVVGPTGLSVPGSFVRVTGVASIEKSAGVHNRVLRTRTSGDVLGA